MDERASTYLPGLDGLRGLAVAIVVGYHFALPGFSGGFLGVDVFFVISGYLVTTILSAEMARSGRIDVRAFWLRRARRLWPALLTLLAGISVTYGFRIPEKLAGGRLDIAASAVFTTNWRLIATSSSYFDGLGRPPLTRHLWSLAIEGQFYAVWPIVLGAIGVVAAASRRRMATLTAVLGVISALWAAVVFRPDADPSRVYFGTDTRLVAVLFGAALALWVARDGQPVAAPAKRSPAPARELVGFACLGALAGSVAILRGADPLLYRGGFAFVALVSAGTVWAATQRGSVTERLLAGQPLTWLGLRSYSLYLWHWPVVAMTQPGIDVPIGMNRWVLAAGRLAASMALTELSFRFVETPFRQQVAARWFATLAGRPEARRRSPRWFVSTAAGAVIITAGAAGVGRAAQNDGIADSLRNPIDEVVVDAPVPTQPVSTLPAPAVILEVAPTVPVPTTFPPPPPDPRVTTTTLATAVGRTSVPSPTTTLPPRPPFVLAIGDSIMKGAAPALSERLGSGSVIDAAVSRPFFAGTDVFVEQTAKRPPFGAVVVHLGNNGVPTEKQFDALLRTIGPNIPVLLVTMREARPWAPKLNALLREETKLYPNIRVLDWNAASDGRSYLFGKDKLHLSGTGARYYSDLIVWGLEQAGYVSPYPTPSLQSATTTTP